MAKVSANGITQHVQRLPAKNADGPAPVVLLMHGIGTDSLASYYFTVGPVFANAGFDVVMYDLRGHGRSERPPSGYRLADLVADAHGLLDALELTEPVHLIGNSFGGTIGFGLAHAHPERVASLAFIESEPATAAWASKMAGNLNRAKEQLPREEAIAWLKENYGAHTARLARGASGLLLDTSMVADVPDSAVLDERAIASVLTPVLAVYGSESDLAVQADWLAGLLPEVRTMVLDGQEHSVLIEQPALSGELLLDWLRSRAAAVVGQ